MTRKSALPTVAPLKNMGPPAPRDLPLPSQALWAEICGSLPSSYFTPGDLPLLRAFCLASHHKAGADALVQRDGLLIDGKVNPAIDLSVKLAGSMAALSSKLRLCKSATTRPESAGLKKALHSSVKPWETSPEMREYFND
jgi:phage terminase small subunit